MKFLFRSCLIAVLVLLPSAVFSQGEILWNVYIDPSFMGHDGQGYFIWGNTSIEIEIQARNHTEQIIEGISTAWKIYGQGDIAQFNYNGGGEPIPGVVRAGGFEEGGFWDLNNTLTSWSWDGAGIDSLGHNAQASSGNGWIQESGLSAKYKLLMNIPDYDYESDGLICIDSIDTPYTGFDWLFSPQVASIFGGPYCFPVKNESGPEIEFDNWPVAFITQHNIPFNYTLHIIINYNGPIASASASIGEIEIIQSSFDEARLRWIYDPPCDWAVDGQNHQVTIDVSSSMGGIYSYIIDLIVTNSPPVFSGPYGDSFYAPLGLESQVVFEASDINGTEEHIWTVTFDPEPVGIYSINQGVVSFTAASEDVGNTYEVSVSVNDCEKYSFQAGFYYKAVGEPVCGDLDYDGLLNILDILALIDFKFKDIIDPIFFPLEIGDVNSDGSINILDIVYYINHKFKGGPAPNCPDPF